MLEVRLLRASHRGWCLAPKKEDKGRFASAHSQRRDEVSNIPQQIELLKLEAEMLSWARKLFDVILSAGGQSSYRDVLGPKDYDILLDNLSMTLHKALMAKAPKV